MNKTILFSAAVAGLIASSAVRAQQSPSATKTTTVAEGECHGVNACKGKGECGGAGHSCAGKNSCKGKGWTKLSEKDCKKQGGKFVAQKM